MPILTLTLADYITNDESGTEVGFDTLPDADVEMLLRHAYSGATSITVAGGVATVHFPDPDAGPDADLVSNPQVQVLASTLMAEALRQLPTLDAATLTFAAAETERLVENGEDWRSPDLQYELTSLPGRYTGLQVMAIGHVLAKVEDADYDLVPAFREAYVVAVAAVEKGT
jgi:hypothetical protein